MSEVTVQDWHLWLARSGYGCDYWTPDIAPPITLEELVEAYYLIQNEAGQEGWAGSTHDEIRFVLMEETGAFSNV